MTKLSFSVHNLAEHCQSTNVILRLQDSSNQPRPDMALRAADLTRNAHSFNATFRPFTAEQLLAWTKEPEHQVVIIESQIDNAHFCIAAVLVCHADDGDFIADGFYVDDRFTAVGLQLELIRHVAHLALSYGCGAVVLPIADGAIESEPERLFKSLASCVETVNERMHEFAFAALAVDDVLASSLVNMTSSEVWQGGREMVEALGRLFSGSFGLQGSSVTVSIEPANPALTTWLVRS
jgi:hypothetical protein